MKNNVIDANNMVSFEITYQKYSILKYENKKLGISFPSFTFILKE